MKLQKIRPSLWFDTQAEEAVRFYLSVFKDAAIMRTSYYTEAGKAMHRQKPGSVLAIDFQLAGQEFIAMNGGPMFRFTEAISLTVNCEDQKEIDYYWERLGEGGDVRAQQCGWLKDQFGLSWQVVPEMLPELLTSDDLSKVEATMTAMMKMKKLVIADLLAAAG